MNLDQKFKLVSDALIWYDNVHRKHWAIDLKDLERVAKETLEAVGVYPSESKVESKIQIHGHVPWSRDGSVREEFMKQSTTEDQLQFLSKLIETHRLTHEKEVGSLKEEMNQREKNYKKLIEEYWALKERVRKAIDETGN